MKRSAAGDAERHLRKAVTLDLNDGWAYIYLGTYFWQSKNVQAAVEEFQRAKSLEPNWAVPLWSLGNIYDQESIDLSVAQSFFERGLAFQPDNWNALKGIARVHRKQGRFALAKEFITRALQQYPRHEQSLKLLEEIVSRDAGDH